MGSIFKKNILKIRGVQPPPNFSTQNSGGVATPQPPYFGAPGYDARVWMCMRPCINRTYTNNKCILIRTTSSNRLAFEALN